MTFIIIFLLIILIVLLASYICFYMTFYVPQKNKSRKQEYIIPDGKAYEPFKIVYGYFTLPYHCKICKTPRRFSCYALARLTA